MSAQGDADVTVNDEERQSHTHVFNPFQIRENCFYVALGRVLSLDSATLASWVGKDEGATNDLGLDISGISKMVARIYAKDLLTLIRRAARSGQQTGRAHTI